MTTIREIAVAAGVSTATVSRVVNGVAGVDPGLASRVQAAIDELGYTPNLVARGLRTQATKVIALVVADIENPFFTSVCRGVEDVARRHGFSVMLCNSDEDLTKESEYLEILAAQSVAGVIISAASDASSVAALTRRGISVVAIGRRLGRETDCVRSDSHAGARTATDHLLDHGAHRVACITGPHGVATAEERLEGYRDALERARLPFDPELIEYANFREDGSYQATRRMLELDNPPDAIFVANNRMVVGTLRACREAGVEIPNQVSIVGFDDLPWADLTTPSITTLRQPTYEIGSAAARLLIERLGGNRDPRREIVYQPELVIRQSSQKSARSGATH